MVEGLAEDLERAAALGDEMVQHAAKLVGAALAPSVKLRFLEGLEQAASELATSIPGATVEVRLQDGDPVLFLSVPEELPLRAADHPDETAGTEPGDGEPARVTLRLPERMKTQIEAAAAADGLSVNAWLVGAAARVLQAHESSPGPGFFGAGLGSGIGSAIASGLGRRGGPKRVTGFVRG